jgi:hypothetical protein
VVTLDRESFLAVLAESEAAKADLDSQVRRRAKHQTGIESQMLSPQPSSTQT